MEEKVEQIEEEKEQPKNRKKHNYAPARYFATGLYMLALGIDIFHFIYETVNYGFTYYGFTILFIDVIFGFFLIYGISRRNLKLLDLMLIIYKVFDGTYFMIVGSRRIDAEHFNMLDSIASYLVALAGIVSFITLLFFCLHTYFKNRKFWTCVKISIIVTGIILAVAVALMVTNVILEPGLEFYYMTEVLFMCMQTFVIYAVCEYVDNYF